MIRFLLRTGEELVARADRVTRVLDLPEKTTRPIPVYEIRNDDGEIVERIAIGAIARIEYRRGGRTKSVFVPL